MIIEKEFMGLKDWVWWFGTVESVVDPMEIGRVKVRVFGYYNQDSQAVPTEQLPWCYQILPVTSASHDRHGFSPTGVEPGSWVVGFFLDGRKGQFPVIFGTIHGIHASQLTPGGGSFGGSGQTGSWGQGGGQSPVSSPGSYGPQASPPGNLSGNAQIVMEEFVKAGYSRREAAAVASNFVHESSLSPTALNQNDCGAGCHSFGLGQWNRGRYNALVKFGQNNPGTTWHTVTDSAGKQYQVPDTRTQAAFSAQEWNSPAYKAARGNLAAGNYDIAMKQYEGYAGGLQHRSDYADKFNSNFDDTNIDTPETEATPEPTQPEQTDTQYESSDECSATSPPVTSNSLDYSTYATCPEVPDDKADDLDAKQNATRTDIPLGGDASFARTPESKDVGQYPMVETWQAKDGVTRIEMDSTPGAERLKLLHKSGTYYEVDAAGNLTMNSEGSSMRISKGNTRDYAIGDQTITSSQNMRILAQQQMSIQADQGMSLASKVGFNLQTDGPLHIAAGGDITFQGSSVKIMGTEGSVDIRSSDELNLEATGEMNINAGKSSDAGSEGGISIDSAGPITMNTPNIAFNADSKMKFESPDMSFKGANIKLETITVSKAYIETLNWEKTNSDAKHSKYADFALQAGGEASNWQAGDSEKQERLDSAKDDPAYPAEQPGGPYETSIATRKAEAKALEKGGKVPGGERDQGSGGSGAAKHTNAQPAPGGIRVNKVKTYTIPAPNGGLGDAPAPRTGDALTSDSYPDQHGASGSW